MVYIIFHIGKSEYFLETLTDLLAILIIVYQIDCCMLVILVIISSIFFLPHAKIDMVAPSDLKLVMAR